MAWLETLSAVLLRRRLLGMSLREFAELASSDPAAAAFILRSVADLMEATGNRLHDKSGHVKNKRRSSRLRRRARQRIRLAFLANRHAQDLFYMADGQASQCSADPLREPLT